MGKANAFHEEAKYLLFGLIKVHVRLLPFPAQSFLQLFTHWPNFRMALNLHQDDSGLQTVDLHLHSLLHFFHLMLTIQLCQALF